MHVHLSIYLYTCILVDIVVLGAAVFPGTTALFVIFEPRYRLMVRVLYEQALVSLKLEKSVDAEGGRTFAVVIEGG